MLLFQVTKGGSKRNDKMGSVKEEASVSGSIAEAQPNYLEVAPIRASKDSKEIVSK